MRKLLTISCLLFIFSVSAKAFSPVQILLTDGTVIEGVARYPRSSFFGIVSAFNARSIQFRQDRDSRTERIKSNDIRTIRYIRDDGSWVEFDRFPVVSFNNPHRKPRNPMFLNVRERGPITVYANVTVGGDMGGSTDVYIRRENDEIAFEITWVGYSFAETGSEFFSGSPTISEKIRNREQGYRRTNIMDIIREYNAEMLGE